MWRRNAWIIALGVALYTPPEAGGQESRPSDTLISQLNWVRFDVVMGRVLATCSRAKQDRHRARREHPSGATETLSVTIDHGLISLRYLWTGARQTLAIDVIRRDRLQVHWTHPGRDERPMTVIYAQDPRAAITLTLKYPDESTECFRGASLWHLALAHPDVCQEHLLGVLENLRPNWEIQRDVARLRTALLRPDPARPMLARREVELLVDQLAEKDFQVRRRADRELRNMGRSVLCFLDDLDVRRLDAEQRLRVQSIRMRIEAENDDTPARVAAWLVNDTSVWLALLENKDPHCRRVASTQLARLSGRAIDFNPDADEHIRAQQVARLHASLQRR